MAKEKVICDTDVMIDYWDRLNPRHVATKSELEISIGLDNVVLSAVTKMELIVGATNKADMQKIVKQLTRFNVALINDDITLKSLSLLETYHLSHGLSLPDGIIAATTLVTDLTLFTYNVKHYKFISRLKLYTK